MLAGLWGSGTGSTSLTENVHTISITRVANRRVVQIGAILLIFCSLIGTHTNESKSVTVSLHNISIIMVPYLAVFSHLFLHFTAFQ